MISAPDDTIAAIATPLGEGGIGVVRISGPEAEDMAKKVFRAQNTESAYADASADKHRTQELKSHKASHGWIIDPQNKSNIDKAVVTYFKAPKSYTGEDTIEISCHGSPVVLKRILHAAIQAGARQAVKGEFTKRAFMNGKVDLVQAEAVLDLIKAKTEDSALLAVKQLSGHLSEKIKALREELIRILAGIEASIDFPDEIEDEAEEKLAERIEAIISKINVLLASADFGKIMREGLATVIIGKPNVGKSSLLNALLKEERAIVTEIPGTTRDSIEEHVNIEGLPLRIIDTAGIRHPKDKIEEFGVERTRREIAGAELILTVVDASEELTKEDQVVLSEAKASRAILVLNKKDKGLKVKDRELPNLPRVRTSALYGEGVKELEKAILGAVKRDGASQESVVINLRHKECLMRAKEALEKAAKTARADMAADFVAIDLKGAILALGEVTGEAVTEEVLDRIFKEFCVGK